MEFYACKDGVTQLASAVIVAGCNLDKHDGADKTPLEYATGSRVPWK